MEPEDLDKLFRAKLENHQGAPQLPAWGRLEERLQQPHAEHSVDALFRRKLENHLTPLPENLWARLQARLNGTETKTRPMWVWYAAACIGLLLSVGGLWKFQLLQPTQMATNTEVTAPGNTQTTTPGTPKEIHHPQTEQLAQAKASGNPAKEITGSDITGANAPENGVSGVTKASAAGQPVTSATQLAVNAPKSGNTSAGIQPTPNRSSQKTQQVQNSEVTPADQPKNQVSPGLDETGPVVIGTSPQLAVAEPLKVDIILTTDTGEAPQAEEKEEISRGKFAKRLAKNLLKVKNGEKPNLQELGLAQSYTMQVKTRTQTLSKTINL